MKKYLVTAAALMFGTSALAWAPAEKAHIGAMHDGTLTAEAWSDWSKDSWSAEKSPLAFSSFEAKNAMKTASGVESSASMTKSDDVVPAMFAKWSDPTVATASAAAGAGDVVPAMFAKWEDPTVVSASASGDASAVQTASADVAADDKPEHLGMGGPLETEAQGYPTCRPGPGDDRCIQLYERGVTAELAAWKGTEPGVAMGGPYEPAASGSKEQAASHSDHQGMNHGNAGSATAQGSGPASADMSKPAATPSTDAGTGKPPAAGSTSGTTPGAIGGPIESQTGYPPCRPGRGDDRCIQLYERGVTGRDN